MKQFLLAITLLIAATSQAFCLDPETNFNFKAPFHLASPVAQADSITIEYHTGKEKLETTFIDQEWNQKLSAILRGAIYQPQSLCFCYSTPIIRIKKNGAQVLQLSVHHGEKLRVFSTEISGDFLIGTEACSKISAMAIVRPSIGNESLPPLPSGGTPKQ
jgi:hypothetical protein